MGICSTSWTLQQLISGFWKKTTLVLLSGRSLYIWAFKIQILCPSPFKRAIFKIVSDLKNVKTDMFSLRYTNFNVCKKEGNYCCMQDNTVLQLFPTFFPDIEITKHKRKNRLITMRSQQYYTTAALLQQQMLFKARVLSNQIHFESMK